LKLKYLYVSLPFSIVFYYFQFNTLCFIATIISIIPLSSTVCNYTDLIARRFGDKLGGMINATTGNLPELLICFFALKSGMYDLVKSGLIGSIIGNMLLVQGISIFFGGLKYNEQKFNKNIAKTNFGLLFLALTGILIATIYNKVSVFSYNMKKLSLGIAIILIIIYLLGLVFSLVTHRNLFYMHNDESEDKTDVKITRKCIFVLALVSTFMVVESHILVNTLEYISSEFQISQHFLGIIVVPLVGNVVEYITAILMALKNKVSLCIEIAIGSSMQIALFVAPVLVIVGFFLNRPISFAYETYHTTSLIISIGLSFYVFQDGKTYWIEGAILLGSYFIIALGYFFM
jgi:Ca2+:H+ antiporter